MKNKALMLMASVGLLAVSASARAHVAPTTSTVVANKSSVLEMGVGHGCEGADTYAVTVDIPKGVTSVRPMWSPGFKTSFTVDAADPKIVTSVTWQKVDADVLPADTNYYKLPFRAKFPDAPLSSIYVKSHQTCKALDGTLSYVDWVALPGEMGEPASALALLPDRLPGWNKYAVPADIADLSVFFKDALVVWRGTSAYSFNDNTVELINTTAGVTLLAADGVKANDQLWVRY